MSVCEGNSLVCNGCALDKGTAKSVEGQACEQRCCVQRHSCHADTGRPDIHGVSDNEWEVLFWSAEVRLPTRGQHMLHPVCVHTCPFSKMGSAFQITLFCCLDSQVLSRSPDIMTKKISTIIKVQ